MIIRTVFVTILISFFIPAISQEITVKGIVFDKDSVSPMQFAYVVDKNMTTGIVADANGKFSLRVHSGDTLCFSYVGYSVTKIYTHLLKDSVKNSVLNLKAYLRPKSNELKPVIVTPHTFSKEQKETYRRKIDEYHRGISNPLASPIDALYYTFSKKGKELQKLSVLYDQLLIDEVKEARLNPERVRNITGNDTLNVQDFLYHCFLPDQFVVSASDYDLFLAVNKYYKEYMAEKRRKK